MVLRSLQAHDIIDVGLFLCMMIYIKTIHDSFI